MKTYNITCNVGTVKYLVSYFSGRKNPDGSAAMDIALFRNKKKMKKLERQLLADGYEYKF